LSDSPWKQLCEAITKEQDPQKLLALVDELNRELERQPICYLALDTLCPGKLE
jgi:hypothetical protein